MTKLYYDDPLKAAIMARDFGVKYQYGEAMEFHFDSLGRITTLFPENYYIHPDSVAIFEPQEGDMNEFGLLFKNSQWLWHDDKPCEEIVWTPIFQRDGKHFYQPLEEKASA